MSNSVIGALRVNLGLDSASFENGLNRAQGGLSRFASLAKTGALAIGAAMLTAGTALGVAMKGVIDQADEMSKASQSLGIPIDQLSRLRYAADLAGVPMEGLSTALRRLSVNLLEASQRADSTAGQAFRMLGINVRGVNGVLKSSPEIIEEVSDRFADMPDGVEKTATAIRLFGRAGADMIPLLNGGSEALREAYREAEELGIVLDEQTGRAAEAFNDNLTRLGVVKDGIVTKITAGMLPALESITDAMVGSARNTVALKAAGEALGWTLKALVSAASAVGGAFIVAAHGIGAAATAAMKFAQGDLQGAQEAWMRGDAAIKQTIDSTGTFIRDVWSPPSGDTVFHTAGRGLDEVAGSAGRARQAVRRLTEEEREAERAAEDLRRAGERTFNDTRTAAERYEMRVAELRRQLQAAAIDQDTFNRAMRDAQDAFEAADPKTRMREQMAEAARDAEAAAKERRIEDEAEAARFAKEHQAYLRESTYYGISDGIRAAADGNLGQYLAARLREKLFDGLATTLTDLFSPNVGKDGKVSGGILSSLAKFLPGFATGGSFKVGGAGGVDSQMVAFRATPGEMVDIRRPGQLAASEGVKVLVNPSPFFDVAVERVAGPLAAQAGVQAFGGARQAVPADLARQSAYRRR